MLLNYNESGQGRPIIILHGLFGSARNWQGISRKLTEDYHVITPDLRNHGESPHKATMSYQEMADDIVSLINSRGLNDVIIIGHSMGGKVAMAATLTRPEFFTALIVADIAPVSYKNNFDTLISAMKTLPLDQIKNRNDAEAHLANSIQKPGLIQFLLQNLIRVENNFSWRINLQGISNNMESIHQFPDSLNGKSNRLPSLFLGGAESDYIRSIYNPQIYQYFPAAEIKMIAGTGHWLHAEKPEVFLKEVKTFINYV